MEKQRRSLGEMLVALGRIDEAQVQQALEYQRAHGGYFGDALVALGLITRDQLNWTLADQFGLAFVQLRPEGIDRAVAAQVPASWAREHRILPVLRAGELVTVVLDNPLEVERLDEVRRFTGAGVVEASLASPENVAALIEAVHGPEGGVAIGLPQLVAEALGAGAGTFGVSVRRGRVLGWYRVAERTELRPLGEGWIAELESLVSPLPPLALSPVYAPRRWPAILVTDDAAWRIECHALGRGDALEWSATIEGAALASPAPAAVPEPLRTELATAAARPDGVVIRAHGCDPAGPDDPLTTSLEAVLPTLPAALLGATARALHVSDRPVAVAHGLLYLLARDSVAEALAGAEAFALDAVTLDVEQLAAPELEAARRVAPLVVFRSRMEAAPDVTAEFDLCLRADDQGELRWTSSNPRNDGTD